MTTDNKLVAVASALLDSGEEEAVTLRAVGHAAGLLTTRRVRATRNRGVSGNHRCYIPFSER